MPGLSAEIAGILNRHPDALDIEGANPFRVRAYQNAAGTIEGLPHSVQSFVGKGNDVSEQTDQIIRAMDHPYFHIFAHPTGWLEPKDIFMTKPWIEPTHVLTRT